VEKPPGWKKSAGQTLYIRARSINAGCWTLIKSSGFVEQGKSTSAGYQVQPGFVEQRKSTSAGCGWIQHPASQPNSAVFFKCFYIVDNK